MWTASFRYSWRKMEAEAQDRAGWRQVVCGLRYTSPLGAKGLCQVSQSNETIALLLAAKLTCI